jgi:hypothetical protein
LGRLANIIALRMIKALIRLGRPLKEPLARAILKQGDVSEDEFFDAY